MRIVVAVGVRSTSDPHRLSSPSAMRIGWRHGTFFFGTSFPGRRHSGPAPGRYPQCVAATHSASIHGVDPPFQRSAYAVHSGPHRCRIAQQRAPVQTDPVRPPPRRGHRAGGRFHRWPQQRGHPGCVRRRAPPRAGGTSRADRRPQRDTVCAPPVHLRSYKLHGGRRVADPRSICGPLDRRLIPRMEPFGCILDRPIAVCGRMGPHDEPPTNPHPVRFGMRDAQSSEKRSPAMLTDAGDDGPAATAVASASWAAREDDSRPTGSHNRRRYQSTVTATPDVQRRRSETARRSKRRRTANGSAPPAQRFPTLARDCCIQVWPDRTPHGRPLRTTAGPTNRGRHRGPFGFGFVVPPIVHLTDRQLQGGGGIHPAKKKP